MTTTYRYDNLGRLRRIVPASSAYKTTEITYDNRDRTDTVTDGNGRKLYDYQTNTDRLDYVEVLTPGLVSEAVYGYAYDDVGNRTQLTGPVGSTTETTTFTWDDLNGLAEVSGPGAAGTVGYDYDPAGNLETLTTGGNHVRAYTYNNLNQATSIVYSAPGVSDQTYTLGYDGDGQTSSITYPNGVVTTYTYDDAGRLDDLLTVKGSTDIVDQTVGHTASGSSDDQHRIGYVIDRVNSPTTRTIYSYDTRGRLTEAATRPNAGGSNLTRYTYTYDADSNRLTAKETVANNNNTFTYDTLTSRITADTSGNYTYDTGKAGNLVASPDYTTLDYNSAGQLTSADPAGSQGATSIDYNGPDNGCVRFFV